MPVSKKGQIIAKKAKRRFLANLKALGLEQRQAGHHGWKESHPEWPDKIVGAKKINEKSQKSPKIFKNRENAIFTRSIGLIGIYKYIFSHGALPGHSGWLSFQPWCPACLCSSPRAFKFAKSRRLAFFAIIWPFFETGIWSPVWFWAILM